MFRNQVQRIILAPLRGDGFAQLPQSTPPTQNKLLGTAPSSAVNPTLFCQCHARMSKTAAGGAVLRASMCAPHKLRFIACVHVLPDEEMGPEDFLAAQGTVHHS